MSTKTQRMSSPCQLFGLPQGLSLGGILLACVLVAVLVSVLKLPALLGGVLPGKVVGYLGAILFAVEIIAYAALSWSLSARSLPVTAAGVGIALGVRLIAGLLLLLAARVGLLATGPAWAPVVNHLLVIGAALLALHAAFQPLLHARFGAARQQKVGPAATRVSFQNKRAPQASAQPVQIRREIVPVAEERRLAPPEGFVFLGPASDVQGTVSVPCEVILQSIPAAAEWLPDGKRARLPLAYLVPQLHRPTAWLTWEMLATCHEDPGTVKAPFHKQWVKIPVRHFLAQVPQEFFERKPGEHSWAKLPAVPQEADFLFSETVAR